MRDGDKTVHAGSNTGLSINVAHEFKQYSRGGFGSSSRGISSRKEENRATREAPDFATVNSDNSLLRSVYRCAKESNTPVGVQTHDDSGTTSGSNGKDEVLKVSQQQVSAYQTVILSMQLAK